MLKEGQALNSQELERGLLLLSDLPGLGVNATLQPGASVGSSDLDISISPQRPYTATLFADNYGSRYTGQLRGGSVVSLGNLANLGDSLNLQLITSQALRYGRAAWQTPINNQGTQAGIAYSAMRYHLIKDYDSIDAHGSAINTTLYIVHPFIRSRRSNLNGQLAYDYKRLHDVITEADSNSAKHIHLLTLSLAGNWQDNLGGGGQSKADLALSGGELGMDGSSYSLDQNSYQSAGHFAKLQLSTSRLQALCPKLQLYVKVNGQLTHKNLDSAEKMSLGGSQGVRAYPQGEALVDDGWLATAELRYQLVNSWQTSLFYDQATGKASHSPLASDENNHKKLAGYGLGLRYARKMFDLNLTMAWRQRQRPETEPDRTPRIWLQTVVRF